MPRSNIFRVFCFLSKSSRPLSFLPNCHPGDQLILLGDAHWQYLDQVVHRDLPGFGRSLLEMKRPFSRRSAAGMAHWEESFTWLLHTLKRKGDPGVQREEDSFPRVFSSGMALPTRRKDQGFE